MMYEIDPNLYLIDEKSPRQKYQVESARSGTFHDKPVLNNLASESVIQKGTVRDIEYTIFTIELSDIELIAFMKACAEIFRWGVIYRKPTYEEIPYMTLELYDDWRE